MKKGVDWKFLFFVFFGMFLLILLSGLLGAVTRTCYSCGNCTVELRNSSIGDVIKLNHSISIDTGTCITNNGGKGKFILDCQNHTISGNGTASTGIHIQNMTSATIRNCNITNFTTYGITSNVANSNNTFRNIKLSYMPKGISIPATQNSTITEIFTDSITDGFSNYGIGLWADCRNNTISHSILNNSAHGINIQNSNNTYIDNVTVTFNTKRGIYIELGSFNNTINNSYVANNTGSEGIYILESNYTTITNTIVRNNTGYGIRCVWLQGTIIKTSSIDHNTGWGVSTSNFDKIIGSNISYNEKGVSLGNSISIINTSVQENEDEDIYPFSSQCNDIFVNVTSSGGRAIEYYNHSVNLQNKTLSQLILCKAHYSNLTNITIQGSDTIQNNAFYVYYTNFTNLSKINSSDNYYGIYLYRSGGNSIRESTANNNLVYGIYFYQDTGAFVFNSTLQENEVSDINIYHSSTSHCSQNFTSINGSGGRAIEYYNHSVNLQHRIFSELILCNADSSNLENITIKGSNEKSNNWLFSQYTGNSNFSNINSSFNYDGVYLYYSHGNFLQNILVNNNSEYGIYFRSSDNNSARDIVANNNSYGLYLETSSNMGNTTLTNLTTNYNSDSGILLYTASNNMLSNITSNYNTEGVTLFFYSRNNTISNITANYNSVSGINFTDVSSGNILKDSHIQNNGQYGIYFGEWAYYTPNNTLIYNNFLNNTINCYNYSSVINYFNTTKTLALNIIGGDYIGGNFWATPTGTGFSQNITACNDADDDGICDTPYNVDGTNYDYLPLTTDLTPPGVQIIYPLNNTNTSNINIDINYTVSDNIDVSSCWYSNDTYLKNTTLTNCGTNITNIVWIEGQHNVTVWVNDTNNNLNKTSVRFTVDSRPPNINITYPINNSNWSVNTIDVNYTRSDTNLQACWYSNDTFSKNITLASCGNLTTVIWSEGKHNVTIWTNDSFGNVNNSKVTFTIDTTPPYFINLATQNLIEGQSLNYDIDAADSGMGLGSFAINWTNTFNITSTGILRNISGLSVGDYYINVSVNDTLAHLNSSILFVSITVMDITPPNIQIAYPSNNTNTSNTQIDVNYTVSDNVELSACWYSNSSGKVNYTLTGCSNITGKTWLQGINNITIWANDTSTNVNYSLITFFVDTINPDIQIVYPPNNTNTTNENINVNYTVSDNLGLSECWYTNSSGFVNYTIICGQNITGVTWSLGINNVTVWVNDSAGNMNYSEVRFNVSCVESWSCTDWSACSGGIQNRTCTDTNACGTETSKPAENQTCTDETEVPGGGGTLPPANETPITTQTISSISPENPAEILITDSKIDLIKITIAVLETISGASLTLTKVELPSEANLLIGLPVGDSYQTFEIETTGLDNSKIANVTMDFKINKTWLSQRNGTIEDVRLYKKPTGETEWNPLTTTFVSQDDEYYYFSSLSSGFSTFVVFFGRYECQPGLKRCYNSQSQLCLGNATWLVTEKCDFGCDESGECIKIASESVIVYTLVIAVVSIAIILTSYLIYVRLFKKKRR